MSFSSQKKAKNPPKTYTLYNSLHGFFVFFRSNQPFHRPGVASARAGPRRPPGRCRGLGRYGRARRASAEEGSGLNVKNLLKQKAFSLYFVVFLDLVGFFGFRFFWFQGFSVFGFFGVFWGGEVRKLEAKGWNLESNHISSISSSPLSLMCCLHKNKTEAHHTSTLPQFASAPFK